MEDGTATMPGTVVTVLKKFIKGHPRGFGRYYTGTDPWPRPAAVIQAEIDERMPYALSWLRHELGDALEQETALKEARTNSGATDDVAPKPNAGDNK
jgi:hypothetical protein